MGQRGFVTTEFLFAIAIAFGMTLLTFALTFTLSTVEIAQYAVYSASRAQAAGNYDIESQKNQARAKYTALIESKEFAPLFSNGWFTVSKPSDLEIRAGEGVNFEKDYPASVEGRGTYQGVRTTFVAKILEMRVPLLGKATPEGDDGFKTRISALLIREVSHKECMDYMEKRKDLLFDSPNFENRFSRFKKATDIPTPWEDNAC